MLSAASSLCRAARLHPPSADTYRCFSSKAKAKSKGKEKEKEKEEEDTPTASAKKSNKKPHWSQLVFYKVSSKLSAVLQPPEEGLTRPDAIERMWDYIKSNDLQSNDEIVCDEALKKAFGQAKIQRTEILKFLDIHLTRLKP